jgi:hypothetical protein
MKEKIFYVIEDESSYYWMGNIKDIPYMFQWTDDIEKAFSCDTFDEMLMTAELFDVEGTVREHMWMYDCDKIEDPIFQHLKK